MAGQGRQQLVELSEDEAGRDVEQAAPAAMFDDMGIVQIGERQPAAAGRSRRLTILTIF
jgi:hypothetical protein